MTDPSSSIAAMQEFSSVTASSYDAESLAPLLNEKAADGWSVVSIVAAGTNIVAYLQRDADGTAVDVPAADAPADEAPVEAPADEAPVDEAPVDEVVATEVAEVAEPATDSPFVPAAAAAAAAAGVDDTPAPVDEPAGWANAPAEQDTTPAEPAAEASIADLAAQVSEPEPAAAPSPPRPQPAAAESAVPAGWYADPSGRFELRYWDGAAWTEHVSRAGQQFTDPPVA